MTTPMRCNPDHNKFSSLSNTTVGSIFPKLCLWRRSLCSNLGGIGPEKLYRATLTFFRKTDYFIFYRKLAAMKVKQLFFFSFVLASAALVQRGAKLPLSNKVEGSENNC